MKKNILVHVGTAALLWSVVSCGEQPATPATSNTTATTTATEPSNLNIEKKGKPTAIKGAFKGLQGVSKVFLDKRTPDANDIIASVAMNPDGTFDMTAHIEESSVYRLRVGIIPIYLILDGGETMQVEATINGETVQNLQITGSPFSTELNGYMSNTKLNEKTIADQLKNKPSANGFVNLFLVERLPFDKYPDLYKKVYEQLNTQAPNSALTLALNSKISQLEAAVSTGRIEVGAVAPDIRLKNPDGKELSLSSLRGKVVLLDFWASWCGPCRRENPNVVRTYQKYKDKGFTVYSVSLDGLDDQRMMMMQNNPDQIKQAMDDQRNKWLGAIKQDGLEWNTHVSDLRGWSSQAAAMYGVNSIPRTFLLDKNGKIVAMNLRGEQLEQEVKNLLK